MMKAFRKMNSTKRGKKRSKHPERATVNSLGFFQNDALLVHAAMSWCMIMNQISAGSSNRRTSATGQRAHG